MSTATAPLQDDRIRLVEEHCRVENAHDLAGIMATFGEQPMFALNGAEFNGREMVAALYGGFGFGGPGSFSDLHLAVGTRHVNDETIILELVLSGRHTGEWMGIAATGKEFQVPLCAIFTFDHAGKLAGERVYFDSGIVLRQLGAAA